MATRAWAIVGIGVALSLGACGGDEGPATDGPKLSADPGRVTWRRLNRVEYDNTVRDLLGTSLRPAVDFPADDTGYGYDTIANVLSLSPLHVELYERAAELLAAEATRPPVTTTVTRLYPSLDDPNQGSRLDDEWTMLWSNGTATATFSAPLTGAYTLRARAWGQQAGPDPARMALLVDEATVAVFDVTAANGAPATYTTTEPVTLQAGERRLAVAFTNDYYNPDADPPEDRNLAFSWLEVDGPIDPPAPTDGPYALVMGVCEATALREGDRACAEAALAALAPRAWRRPVPPDELARLMALFDAARADGATFHDAVGLTVQAVLMSPHFIFRVELLDAPDAATAQRLSGYEIASRLSYMIWSTMPDAALFAAAADGRLDTPEGIAAEVRRLAADPRAEALVDNFAGQWLHIRNLDNVFPDPSRYPEWDDDLRASMRDEMRHFVRSFFTEDRSMLELLTATESVIDARLAAHYGLDLTLAEGEQLWVDVTPAGRRGLLTQAGLMTLLATPFRTSIVRRGKWVLSQLLCAEPSAPPPGVEALLERDGEQSGPMTLRERMELHQTDDCRDCHAAMDPIGFALEHFDGIGAWRDTDDGLPIDASGQLPDGRTFHGALELVDVLAADPRLPRCMAEQLMTYGLGRGLGFIDRPTLDDITARFAEADHRLVDLLVLIATSDPFRYRTGEVVAPSASPSSATAEAP